LRSLLQSLPVVFLSVIAGMIREEAAADHEIRAGTAARRAEA
jgi:hypothetical protein